MNAAVLPGALQGLSVLAVEDEALVAMCLEDILLDLGCAVLGPAARVHQALKLLDTEHVDIAVLDVNVAGEVVFPVADKLKALGVPFIFATAYGVAGVIAIHREQIVLQKPYTFDSLRRALEQCLYQSRQ